MGATDWRQRIVELVLVKQKIDEVDAEGLWEYRLPGVAASGDQLRAVEQHLGEPLDPAHREFLRHAGGWPAFLQTIDLFGPDDLLGGPRMEHATEMLGYVEDVVLEQGGLRREQLLPIAASPVDLDLFVIARRSAPSAGTVIWLAGAEVDRFPDFGEFFAAMVDYNRLELQKLAGRPRSS